MIPFILADNPDINHEEAFRLSKEMTMGNKMRIFVLNLSFIGWMILSSIAWIIGEPFVYSYMLATYAQLYTTLKENISKKEAALIDQQV